MNLPKNLQTVIMKNAGHVVPKEYLEIILGKKPNVLGLAVQGQADDGSPELSIIREEGTPAMADLEDFQRNAVDFRAMITFGWLEQGFDHADMLPFVINDADDKPFLAIGLEGDFPKHDTNNGRTQEFNLANEIILPSIADICELVDGDIEKLVAALGKPSFNNNFLAQIGHRGVLNILPFEGEPSFFAKNALGGEPFTWGHTSNLWGWGDAKQEPVKVEKKPRFSFGGKKAEAPSAPKEATPPALPKVEASKTSVPAVKPTETKAAEPQPIRPPSWCHSNDDKKSWYQAVCGNLPKGWKHNIPVIPTVGVTPPAKIEDLQAWRAAKKKEAIAATTVKPAAPVTQTSAGPVKTAEEVKAIKNEENLPIIPAKDMEKVLDFVAKHIDGQSAQMIAPDQIQAMESKIPTFSECLGLKPQELLNWSPSSLFALAKHDSRAIALMAIEMRNLWRNTLKLEDLTGTLNTEKANDRVTTTVTKTGGTTKVESVANDAPPARKKMFSFGKKAAA